MVLTKLRFANSKIPNSEHKRINEPLGVSQQAKLSSIYLYARMALLWK